MPPESSPAISEMPFVQVETMAFMSLEGLVMRSSLSLLRKNTIPTMDGTSEPVPLAIAAPVRPMLNMTISR